MNLAFIAMGSNIQPEQHLPWAVRRFRATPTLGSLLAVSQVCQSAPVGFLGQADFCNAAMLLSTDLEPDALRDHLRGIERESGRQRDPANKNAPRTLDLDIAIYGQRQIESETLTIPDPEITVRPFLAAPLAQLDPAWIVAGDGRSLEAIATSIESVAALLWRDDIRLGEAGHGGRDSAAR